MPYEFKLTRRVEFSETDMAGIVHYSNFFRYMESAEHAFFRSLGFSIFPRPGDPPLGWPRVHATCDFQKPLQFEDEVEIHLLVSARKARSISYLFRIRKLNAAQPEDIASGAVTVVCVRHSRDKMTAVRIPSVMAQKIQVAPRNVLEAAKRHPKKKSD